MYVRKEQEDEMRQTKYVHEFGSYYLYEFVDETRQSRPRLMADRITMAYDKETFTLFKHGSYADVQRWWAGLQKTSPELAKDVCLVTFPNDFSVDEINHAIATAGYLRYLLPRAISGVA